MLRSKSVNASSGLTFLPSSSFSFLSAAGVLYPGQSDNFPSDKILSLMFFTNSAIDN